MIESLGGLLHNPPAFTSPVDEVLRGVRTRGLKGGGCGRPPPAFLLSVVFQRESDGDLDGVLNLSTIQIELERGRMPSYF